MSSIRSRKHSANPYALTALALPLMVAPVISHAAAVTAAEADSYHREHGEEITIKGERRAPYKQDKSSSKKATADLLDTPQTVQVIGKEIIREQGATTLTEALRNSAGVGTFYLGENGSTSTGDAIYMRGTDSSGNIFVDGVRDVAAISRDVFNIESVEVLKGAAGADVGRGSATGAINIYSKHAAPHTFANASIAAGGGDFARATADLNWRLGERSALRLNLMDQDAGVAGRDVVTNKRWGVASSLGFGLGASTRYFLDYMHVEQDNIPDGGVLTIGLPGYSSPDPTNRAYLTQAAPVNPKNFYGTQSDFEDIQTDVLTLSVEHDFNNGLRVSNITRWSETSQNYQLSSFMASNPTTANPNTGLITPDADDPGTWMISRNMNNRDAVNTMLTNQTNLQAQFATGSLEHSISTGIELIREEAEIYTHAATGGDIERVSVYNPVYAPTVYTTARNGVYTDVKADTIGIYVNDTIQFSRAWQMTAGVRLDHYKLDSFSVPATFVPVRLKDEDDIVSGKLGLVYKPAENGSIYASYAVTKTPPGGTNLAPLVVTTNANNPNTPPQEAKTSEIGTKWDILHNHLSLTGALYSTKYSDAIVLDSDGSYYRSGEKNISGIELGAVGQINPQWNISAGYTIMDSKVKNQTLVAADGSANLTYNPSDSLTVWTTWSPDKRFTIGGGPRYNGEMKRGTDGAIGTPSRVKSYIVFDGSATYQLTRRIQLQANVYNLFDKVYVAAINKSGYRYTPGTPQTFRLAANVNF